MPDWKHLLVASLLCFNLVGTPAFADALLPSQSGFPGQQSQFGLSLTNSDNKTHVFSIQTEQLPQGFIPALFQGNQVAGKITIFSGHGTELILQVAVPENAGEGNYPFTVKAIRDDKVEMTIPLNLRVDNSYVLKIVSTDSNLKGFSGKAITFPVSVSNYGKKDLTGVKLSMELPHKWQVSVGPEKVATLKAGESANFQVKVTIPPTQDAGNQKIKIGASADQVVAEEITVPVISEKSTSYLFVPIAVVGLILVGGLIYIKKQGRR
ncbi:MAG: NEW3 domain-containing protein [Firmicutes bacterium]|nr:NEW3 domain-containing protein [Bacillota bacterium]